MRVALCKYRAPPAFVKWNPSDKGSGITLSLSDTRATFATFSPNNIRGTIGRSSGKYYFRVKRDSAAIAAGGDIGIANASCPLTSNPGLSANGFIHQSNGFKGNGSYSAYGVSWDGANDEVGIAYDVAAAKLFIGKGAAGGALTWMASSDPVTGANPMFSGITAATYYPMGGSPVGSGVFLEFVYDTPPSGYTYW